MPKGKGKKKSKSSSKNKKSASPSSDQAGASNNVGKGGGSGKFVPEIKPKNDTTHVKQECRPRSSSRPRNLYTIPEESEESLSISTTPVTEAEGSQRKEDHHEEESIILHSKVDTAKEKSSSETEECSSCSREGDSLLTEHTKEEKGISGEHTDSPSELGKDSIQQKEEATYKGNPVCTNDVDENNNRTSADDDQSNKCDDHNSELGNNLEETDDAGCESDSNDSTNLEQKDDDTGSEQQDTEPCTDSEEESDTPRHCHCCGQLLCSSDSELCTDLEEETTDTDGEQDSELLGHTAAEQSLEVSDPIYFVPSYSKNSKGKFQEGYSGTLTIKNMTSDAFLCKMETSDPETLSFMNSDQSPILVSHGIINAHELVQFSLTTLPEEVNWENIQQVQISIEAAKINSDDLPKDVYENDQSNTSEEEDGHQSKFKKATTKSMKSHTAALIDDKAQANSATTYTKDMSTGVDKGTDQTDKDKEGEGIKDESFKKTKPLTLTWEDYRQVWTKKITDERHLMETYEVKNLILIDADPLYINKDQEMFIDEEFNDNYIIPNATLEELNQDKEFPSNNESSGDNEDKENVDVEEKQSSDGLDEEDKEVIIADSSSSTDSDDKGSSSTEDDDDAEHDGLYYPEFWITLVLLTISFPFICYYYYIQIDNNADIIHDQCTDLLELKKQLELIELKLKS